MSRTQLVSGVVVTLGLSVAAWAADTAAPPIAPPTVDAATRARIEEALQKPAAMQPAARKSAQRAAPSRVSPAAQKLRVERASGWTLEDAVQARPGVYYVTPPGVAAPPVVSNDGGRPPPSAPPTPSAEAKPPIIILPPPVAVAPVPPVAVLPSRIFHTIDMNDRAERLLSNADRAIQAGLRDLKAGDYEAAALSFRLASELDQTDSAARIHFAHAALGTGDYEAAGVAVRRALELHETLILMRFEHERYFKPAGEFDRLVDRMAKLMRDEGGVGDEHFLLGYFQQQRGKRDEAAASFAAAKHAGISDDSLGRMLELTATKRR